MVTQTVLCFHCGSPHLTRNGKAPGGKQKYLCHGCGSRQNPTVRAYPETFRAQVLAAYHERYSQRGVCRIFAKFCFGIGRETLAVWLTKPRRCRPCR